MAEPIDTEKQTEEASRLRDEIEQLRTALETSLEENNRLVDDRDRLLARVTTLARDLQAANTAYASTASTASSASTGDTPDDLVQSEKLSQSEEELRVAFEELQVLTEELEAANNSLHLVNRDLDARVEERTREIAEANAALRVSETSLRAIADVVPDLLWRAESRGAVTWYNTRWYDYTGQNAGDRAGHGLDRRGPSRRSAGIADVWSDALKTGRPFKHQHRIRHRDGDYRWFLVRGEPLRDTAGRVSQWFGAVTDIHDLMQLQERQSVLMAELQHRTRNLMAVVETVIRKSLASSRDMADAKGRIEERFGALSRVQGLLSRRPDGARVTFDALLSDELGAHVPLAGDKEASRVTLDGPRAWNCESLARPDPGAGSARADDQRGQVWRLRSPRGSSGRSLAACARRRRRRRAWWSTGGKPAFRTCPARTSRRAAAAMAVS
jgi:PAS domain S-box-containing protein